MSKLKTVVKFKERERERERERLGLDIKEVTKTHTFRKEI